MKISDAILNLFCALLVLLSYICMNDLIQLLNTIQIKVNFLCSKNNWWHNSMSSHLLILLLNATLKIHIFIRFLQTSCSLHAAKNVMCEWMCLLKQYCSFLDYFSCKIKFMHMLGSIFLKYAYYNVEI